MSALLAELAAAEDRVAQLRMEVRASSCREHGHDWQSYGGCNAGCDLGGDCGCSVPVNACTKCGDCAYGDNADAVEVRRRCADEVI